MILLLAAGIVFTGCRSPNNNPIPYQPYTLEYLSGNGQTYMGGGIPKPMVFKIKNTATNQYDTSYLSQANLSLIATAPQGYQDAEFNNLNNYDGQGREGYGGYYYVDPNRGEPYTLNITVTLYLAGDSIDSYLMTENIKTGIVDTGCIAQNNEPSPHYILEYVSGNGLTYTGGGIPKPMVFKIKNKTTSSYFSCGLSQANLSLIATAPQGYQDAEFNNLNNYGGQGREAFGGFYYVDPNRGAPYSLNITVTLSLGGDSIDSYLLTENILTGH
jgi:hypothetical protein